MIITVITFFYFKNYSEDLIKISTSRYTITKIEDRNSVQDLKSIYENIIYDTTTWENTINDLRADKDAHEDKMWLESKYSKDRVFIISFWITKDKVYVFNRATDKADNLYGYIKEEDKDKVTDFISQTHLNENIIFNSFLFQHKILHNHLTHVFHQKLNLKNPHKFIIIYYKVIF